MTETLADYTESVPYPGAHFIIRHRDSNKVITLINGELQLAEGLNPKGGFHWECIERDRWLGFRNCVSGTIIGHNDRKKFVARADKHQSYEYFTLRHSPKGGYELLTKHDFELWSMTIADDGKGLVETKEEGVFILSLFGERVTMQFMSQALGWADCLALAMAPLGIITILVSAIRVGGPKWLKAIIGRAKENTAAAEMELMSSASPEVCELYNGDGIVRCQGTAPVWEFICICPQGYDHAAPDHGLKLEYMTLEKAIEAKLLTEHKNDTQSSLSLSNFLARRFQSNNRPANRGRARTAELANETTTNSHERAGIRFTALLGTLLQGGVLAFFGVISYHAEVKPDFQKDGKPTERFAFPLATAGTLLLVLGMFVCALVVESSTVETLYTANHGSTLLMCWLQQGQTVSDQVFDSYAISQSRPCSVITKSARGKDLRNEHREGPNSTMEIATISGVAVGLAGFVIQFIGLRAMNSAASLAQLGAVGIMTICRALVRPGFATSFEKTRLLPSFELNSLAWKLATTRSAKATPRICEVQGFVTSQMGYWAIATGKETKYEGLVRKEEVSTAAQELMETRQAVCRLASFQSKTSEVAINLAVLIEDALKLFFPAGIKDYPSRAVLTEVSWLINVYYSESSPNNATEQKVSIDLSYSDGKWRVRADSLDAALSLWTHTIQAHDNKETDDSTALTEKGDGWLRRKVPRPSLRLLGPHELISKEQLLQDLELWVPRCLETLLKVDEFWVDELGWDNTTEYDQGRVFGQIQGSSAVKEDTQTRNFQISSLVDKNNIEEDDSLGLRPLFSQVWPGTALGIETYDSLETSCAKDLFYSFMCSVSKVQGLSIEGEPELRNITTSDKNGPKSEFLWHKELSDLAESCQKRDLGTYREALISIISPLSMAQILPFPHPWIQAMCAKMGDAGSNDDDFRVYDMWRDLCYRTQCYSPEKTGIRECGAALLLEIQYDTKRKLSPMDYWFASRLKCERLLRNVKLGPNFREHLQRFPEWSQHLIDFERPRTVDNDDNEQREFPAYFMLTPSHIDAMGGPIYWVDNQEAYKRDIFGRFPLHYFAGLIRDTAPFQLSAYVQHCRELINIQDYHGYTPLHYACMFGLRLSVRYLLEHRGRLDIQGLDGMYPIHLAAREGNQEIVDEIIKWNNRPEYSVLVPSWRLSDYGGYFAVHWATMMGHTDVMEKLSADIDLGDRRGITPLYLAVLYDQPKALRKAAELSKDVDKQNLRGQTPLELAYSNEQWAYVRVLIKAGADPTARDRHGQNAQEFAASKGIKWLDLTS
ncbi:hypothetical protein ACLX1H_005599 [Fusarium chlamydosporum]